MAILPRSNPPASQSSVRIRTDFTPSPAAGSRRCSSRQARIGAGRSTDLRSSHRRMRHQAPASAPRLLSFETRLWIEPPRAIMALSRDVAESRPSPSSCNWNGARFGRHGHLSMAFAARDAGDDRRHQFGPTALSPNGHRYARRSSGRAGVSSSSSGTVDGSARGGKNDDVVDPRLTPSRLQLRSATDNEKGRPEGRPCLENKTAAESPRWRSMPLIAHWNSTGLRKLAPEQMPRDPVQVASRQIR